jgi:hypothetical protein
MITTLLEKKKGSNSIAPSIEIVGEKNPDRTEDDEEEIDWEYEQQVSTEPSTEELLNRHPYGFNDSHSGYFEPLKEELSEIVGLQTPDTCSLEERKKLRLVSEDLKFDERHYMYVISDRI